MIGPRVQSFSRHAAERAVTPLAAVGITPLMLTFAGFFLSIPAAVFLATGQHLVGGILVLLSGGVDMLDGALARLKREETIFGAFIDSTLDRYVEAAVYGGLVWYFSTTGRNVEAIVAVSAMAGSLLVSYAKARAEGLGLECKVGLLQRPERLLLLGVAAALSGWILVIALWVLAIVTHITALQRIAHVYSITRDL